MSALFEVWVLWARRPESGLDEVIGVFSQEKHARALFRYHDKWGFGARLEKFEIDALAPLDPPPGTKYVLLPDSEPKLALVVEAKG